VLSNAVDLQTVVTTMVAISMRLLMKMMRRKPQPGLTSKKISMMTKSL